jgi:hypothetical protein
MSTFNATGTNNLQYASEQQWQAVLTFTDATGTVWTCTFDKFSGGDATSANTKYRPSGMLNEVVVAALPVYSEIMLSKGFNNNNDPNNHYGGDYGLQQAIRNVAGLAPGYVSITPLTSLGVTWGSPRVYFGVVSEISDGPVDSESGAVRSWSTKFTVSSVAD